MTAAMRSIRYLSMSGSRLRAPARMQIRESKDFRLFKDFTNLEDAKIFPPPFYIYYIRASGAVFHDFCCFGHETRDGRICRKIL